MMKDTHFLYSIATLAVGSILAIFASYATDTLPKQTPRTLSPAIATTPIKKDCDCCRQMTPQELAASREQLAALRKQWQAYAKANELLKQHGIKEGLRRIKQSHPEIAEHLEHFTYKYTVAQEH